MNFKYVRIQGKELAKNTMYAKGVFSMCWKLIQDDVMEQEDADLYREIDSWFAEHLQQILPPSRTIWMRRLLRSTNRISSTSIWTISRFCDTF